MFEPVRFCCLHYFALQLVGTKNKIIAKISSKSCDSWNLTITILYYNSLETKGNLPMNVVN